MNPIKDDWQRKGKKYRTKYLDCLKDLYQQAESDDFSQAVSEIREQFKGAIKNLADK